MSTLAKHVADYLAVRRALGYKLEKHERMLGQFLDYLERQGAQTITTEHALAWATRLPAHPPQQYCRLVVVRGFARYLKAIDPDTQVPPQDLLPWCSHRAVPYIYTDEQITALLEATRTLRPPHRAATYQTLLGLLAVTGMRRGEALALDRRDIDLQAGRIEIRKAKFGKSRELPLDPTTVEALHRYLKRRDRPDSAPRTDAVFVSTRGARLSRSCLMDAWYPLLDEAGIEPRSAACRPRVHDLRHTFAVRTLLDSYRKGENPARQVALLSTYLGHTKPTSTYWYLEAVPELMQLAAGRLEHLLGGPR